MTITIMIMTMVNCSHMGESRLLFGVWKGYVHWRAIEVTDKHNTIQIGLLVPRRGGFWLGEGFGGPLSHNLDNLTYISTCTAYFYTYPTHKVRPNFFKILSTPLPVGCDNIALS